MLGMMMDFLRDSIDPVFAKGMLTIYNSTTSVIMGIAAVVAIAQLFQENKDSENDKEEEKPLKRCAGELFLVVAIIFFCYGEYCKLHYYEVPNINFYDSYEKVENEISAPGSIADIVYDEAANQRENEDVEESDGEFKVYGINYVPGSLIYHRMGEKVDIILYVTWDKGRKPISKAEKLDFEFDREKIQPCAEDKFKITASPFLFCSKAKYLGDSSNMVLYNYYDLSKHQVIISLLDAETRKIVQMKRGQLSKPMVFEKLQPGIYYYAVEADGYSPYVSPYSLQVVAGGKKDGWEGAYVSMRETKEESEDEEFRVLVWAGDDYPLPNTKLKAYIEHPNELEEEKENFYKMATDENGFLFFEEDLMNGARPIERRYQLYWNRWMLLSYEDESRDSAVEVEVKDGLGIARLAER